MAYKALIFGTDDLYPTLAPYYAREVERGNLEIVAYAVFENGGIRMVKPDAVGGGEQSNNFELAIISSTNNFYNRMKFLEAQGILRSRIIDGSIFQIPNLDFPRLINEGVAYGIFNQKSFVDNSFSVYPRIYLGNSSIIKFGTKSYISDNASVDGTGVISVGNYSSISWSILFNLGQNGDHNYRNVNNYGLTHLSWVAPAEFYPPQGVCRIEIGNDVWIGRGCNLKCTNPNKPLIIGDGAVIASDSVVVKNVPPYAIVGGNPAKIIKFRFSEDVIESMLRIKWWDWSLDKIHDNFKYFNDIDKFIAMHDKE